MSLSTKQVRKKYDRYSRFYDRIEYPVEKRLFSGWRQELFSGLKGDVLEVGVGTGNNIPFYPENASITAIDISSGMLSKAKIKARKYGKDPLLIQMDAQNMRRFSDNSFDYVVCTFVLCSIPDPVKALKEIRRVLKTRGTFIAIEHVLSEKKIIALLQNLHNPLTRYLFGFNVNRNTRGNILKAGFNILSDEKLYLFDIFRKFTCKRGDD